ncbi:hypothetical protein AB0J86_05685 [Micromonospora sp. NPDC049559]|uniref:hypothetical protein n=1 Tax=Micromonospora sp. NPDC049559 TaxID=3155923 RepID=UPI00341B44E1
MAARVAGLLAAGLAGALALAGPAWAHGADAPDGTDYRTVVTSVTPALPGLTVRVVESGARLELTNHTGRAIEVLGYRNEPYLQVGPDGVYQNLNSPATYLNRTLDGETQPPADADPTLPPRWQRVATEPVVRWHDQRTRWLAEQLPPEVRADPRRPHRIREWTVPLRDNVTPGRIGGTLDWVPPPAPVGWWLGTALGVLVVVAAGLLAGRFATVALAAFGAAGGATAIALATGRQLDAGADGLAGALAGLPTGQTWPLLTGLAAVAAGAYALARRPAADFVLTLGGGCLALFAGIANASFFARSVPPVPWSGGWARFAVAVVLATGAGLALVGMLLMRAAGRAATEAPVTGPAATEASATGPSPAKPDRGAPTAGQAPAGSRGATELGSKP